MDDQLLPTIINILSAATFVQKVYLFGSRARGDASPRSDYDIAVYCPKASESDWLYLSDKIDQLETLLEIDLVRLDTVSENFKQEILKTGKLIYEQR